MNCLQISKNVKEFSTFRMPYNSRPIGVEFDIKDKKIYWSDFGSGKKAAIYRSDMNGDNVESILEPSFNGN